MYRKILIGGMAAAAIVGAGGTALALSGSDTTSGVPAATTVASAQNSRAEHPLRRDGRLLRRVAHGQIVVKGQNGFVTHDLIVGTVTAVSSSSITVKADDGTSETYVVNSDTKVRGGMSSIDKIATGDRVGVAGTGTTTLTAKHVIKLPS